MTSAQSTLEKSRWGLRLDDEEILSVATSSTLEELMTLASGLRDSGHAQVISYSPKVIVPLTKFCQNEWDYCKIANVPRSKNAIYLTPYEILSIARQGKANGCKEILFFLSAKPEGWSGTAKQELLELGYESTLHYLYDIAQKVAKEVGLLPKLHSGVLTRDELQKLREVSVAQGLMLDSQADFHFDNSETSYGVAQAHPHVRLGVAAAAGAMNVPFTAGLVVGLGESKEERIESLLALRQLDDIYGHIQEIVIQDSRYGSFGRRNRISKSLMNELLWTIAVARIIFGAKANIQAPGDLPIQVLSQLLDAGVNDWGSVSPPALQEVGVQENWPQLATLNQVTKAHGKVLEQRLPLYPEYLSQADKWCETTISQAMSVA